MHAPYKLKLYLLYFKKEYQSILDGKPLAKDGEGYRYEGEEFSDWWTFEGGADSKVIVTYSDEGVGFEGALSDCEIEDDEEWWRMIARLKNDDLNLMKVLETSLNLSREKYKRGNLSTSKNRNVRFN